MAASRTEQVYATNLASEFFVLSALYRLGLSANLTLGNKKGVDIVVACAPGRAITIEVKGGAGKNDWLVGKLGIERRPHHYVVLVSYEGQYPDPDEAPRVWVFTYRGLIPFIKSSRNGSTRYISRKDIRERAAEHSQNWAIIRDAAL